MRWTLKKANNEIEQYGFRIASYQGKYKVIKVSEYHRGDSIKECLAWIEGFVDALRTCDVCGDNLHSDRYVAHSGNIKLHICDACVCYLNGAYNKPPRKD